MMVFSESQRVFLESMIEEDVANTILKQMGGARRLKLMVGAKNFVSHGKENALSFRFPNNVSGKPNFVKVRLEPDDTYTMEFKRLRGLNFKDTAKHSDVYVSDLKRIFEKETGLRLSL